MRSPVSAPDAANSRRGLSIRQGYGLYGAQVRNRVIVGVGSLALAFGTWKLQARFPHGTTPHVALIWTTAVLFGVAEFSWSWARLLWRVWIKGKSFTKARLWYELATSVLLTVFFALYVLEWLKW